MAEQSNNRKLGNRATSFINVKDFGATGDGVTDDTTAIQAAIDAAAGVARLFFPSGTYIVGRILIPSNTHIICDPDVTFNTPASITNLGWWRMVDTNNTRIEANGATWEFATKPSADEQRHVFDLRGATNAYIGYSRAIKSGGDGYYVGSGTTDNSCEDVVLDHVYAENNRRQGISLVDHKRCHIINPRCINSTGTSPNAGIDIEANSNDDFCEDLVIDNPVSSGNDGNGIVIALNNLPGAVDKVVNITINNPSSKNDLNGIELEKTFLDGDSMTGRIIINDAVSDTPDRTCFRVRNYDALGPRVDFYDPVAINPNEANTSTTKDYSGYVVFREVADTGATNVGNIHFHRPQCIDNRSTTQVRDWFHIHTETGTDIIDCSVLDPQRIDGVQQDVLLRIDGQCRVSDANGLLVRDMNDVSFTTTPGDTYRTHESTGNTGGKNITLSADFQVGAEMTFNSTTDGISFGIIPDGSSLIEPGSNGAGKKITANNFGDRLTLKRQSSTQWFIIEEIGVWTHEV